ncbi:NACHT domain-containing protein [Glycomyces tritici]|uniref:NACHT domain-containing protein n=1 Tax=Glycomyces tritici TaxID=2665176 RepID=A0ABT7YXT2_9ACTN|nr:NACHT domain-containing protein [Glycomyces tritici]MDN3243413.1 NACHT domain-containing protein [Glycomyces tritici]
MTFRSRALLGLVAACGPIAAVAAARDFALQHPILTLLGVLVAEGLLAIWVIGMQVAGETVYSRMKQMAEACNSALGRRFSRYARRYREYVLSRQRFIDSKDLAYAGAHTPELDAIYVDVDLVQRAPHQVPSGMLASTPTDRVQRNSIQKFIGQEQPNVLAVVGAPGSGKSTLLRYLARNTIRGRKRQRRHVPVLLVLRDLSGQIAADDSITLPELVRSSVRKLTVAEPPGWWESILGQGKCLILLDGLDEVALQSDRTAVTNWIQAQIDRYPKNDFVITSRPHGYRTASIPQANVFQVCAFTPDQVHRFVRDWYRSAERRATGASGPDVEMLADEKSDDLAQRLAAAPALYDLTVNPLLLTMIVLVHRERRALPAGRIDLYSEICEVMLWRRNDSKGLADTDGVTGAQRERILALLAFSMMRGRVRDIAKEPAVEVIKPMLERFAPGADCETYLSGVLSSGLLIERERNLYSFAHLTIAEYLAAKHIRENHLEAVLFEGVDDTWWREVTLLYVADNDADGIVEACLQSGTNAAMGLAFDCVESHGSLAPGLRNKLESFKENAFASESSEQHRRLVASVLASKQSSTFVMNKDGSLICPLPVSADLYWLYCQERKKPYPDCSLELRPSPGDPVKGPWMSDVTGFIEWINAIMADIGKDGLRLPNLLEVQQLPETLPPTRGGDASEAVWTFDPGVNPTPLPWACNGRQPHQVEYEDVLRHAASDAFNSPILLSLATESARALGNEISRTSSLTYMRSRNFSGEQLKSLIEALIMDLKLSKLLITAYDRVPSETWPRIRALVSTLDQDLSLERAHARVLKMSRDSRIDRKLTQASALATELDRLLAELLTSSPTPHAGQGFAAPIEISGFVRSDPETALNRKYDDSDRTFQVEPHHWVRRNIMGNSLSQALAAAEGLLSDKGRNCKHADVIEVFAATILQNAGLDHVYKTYVNLDGLAASLERASQRIAFSRTFSPWGEHVAGLLVLRANPLFTRQVSIKFTSPATIRIPALALAAEVSAGGMTEIADEYRAIAAGVSLLQLRADGMVPLEHLRLARA